eukprot:scaffold37533_cov24-Cyclotella_meneghiniana.AAC.3
MEFIWMATSTSAGLKRLLHPSRFFAIHAACCMLYQVGKVSLGRHQSASSDSARPVTKPKVLFNTEEFQIPEYRMSDDEIVQAKNLR